MLYSSFILGKIIFMLAFFIFSLKQSYVFGGDIVVLLGNRYFFDETEEKFETLATELIISIKIPFF